MTAEAVRIAQEFAQTGDLSRAQAQLATFDVANPTQWLILLVERRVDEAPGTVETDALVRMAVAMGVQAAGLLTYAEGQGLLPGTAAATPQAIAMISAATPVVMATTATGAATGADAPAVEVATSDENATQAPVELPTATAAPATATPIPKPMVAASNVLNVRSGPGTDYPVVGALNAGEQAEIIAKNPESDWWQVMLPDGQVGWVIGSLVQTSGDATGVAVAANIPPAPPTATPAPVVETPAEAPAAAPPAAPAEEAPARSGNDFVLAERRLWDVYENGGFLSGPTVTCGEKRQLVVNVLDANGNRLNGVAVQAVFGAQEIFVTGAQGKGDGVVEYVLGRGQDVKVIRDADGREVTSDVATGMVTEPAGIPYELLIAGRYCTDDASCKKFVDAPGCWGHYSWTVTFRRTY